MLEDTLQLQAVTHYSSSVDRGLIRLDSLRREVLKGSSSVIKG
jgi:hypothetical protein